MRRFIVPAAHACHRPAAAPLRTAAAALAASPPATRPRAHVTATAAFEFGTRDCAWGTHHRAFKSTLTGRHIYRAAQFTRKDVEDVIRVATEMHAEPRNAPLTEKNHNLLEGSVMVGVRSRVRTRAGQVAGCSLRRCVRGTDAATSQRTDMWRRCSQLAPRGAVVVARILRL